MPNLSGAAAVAGRPPLCAMRPSESLARAYRVVPVRRMWTADLRDRRDHFSGHAHAIDDVVSRDVVGDQPEDRRERAAIAAGAGPRELRDRLDVAAQVAAGHVRPGRDRLSGRVEVDETYWGAVEAGVRGRQTINKVLVAVAVEQVGRQGLGRIRMRRVRNASATSLQAFVEDAIEPGTLVHTDGWLGDERLTKRRYRHRITFLRGQAQSPADLLPRVHRVCREGEGLTRAENGCSVNRRTALIFPIVSPQGGSRCD